MAKETITKTVTLALQRETYGTYVYQEGEMQAVKQTFPTIYVKKHVFGGSKPPLMITVTITGEKE